MNDSIGTYHALNATNTTLFPNEPQDDKWRHFRYLLIAVAEAVITMTALVGNFIVVYAFIFYKRLRTSVTNYFIISLAVSDILTSGLVISFKLDSDIRESGWKHGEFMCNLYTTMYLLAVPSSVINLCAVTVDRYLVLRMPLRYNSLMPPRRAVLIISCLWIYAIIWACLPVMGWKQDFPAISNGSCYFLSTREYNITVNIVNFLVPMIFMAVFWSRIYAIVLHHIKRTIKTDQFLNTNDSSNTGNIHCTDQDAPPNLLTLASKENKQKKKIRRRFRGSRYIGFIVMLFYFCWLPYVTLSLIGNMCTEQVYIPRVLSEVFLTLGFLNSALNPFLYPFHDKHFKGAFRDMWKRVRTKSLLKNICPKEEVRKKVSKQRSCTRETHLGV